MWQQLLSLEILCVGWTEKWQSLIRKVFEEWLKKVSHGDPLAGLGVMLLVFAALSFALVAVFVFWNLRRPVRTPKAAPS